MTTMESLINDYMEHIESERNSNAKSLMTMTKYLQRLRAIADRKPSQEVHCGAPAPGDAAVAAAEGEESGRLLVDLALISDMEDILNQKTLIVVRVTNAVRKLRDLARLHRQLEEERACNAKIMKYWDEFVDFFDHSRDYARGVCVGPLEAQVGLDEVGEDIEEKEEEEEAESGSAGVPTQCEPLPQIQEPAISVRDSVECSVQ